MILILGWLVGEVDLLLFKLVKFILVHFLTLDCADTFPQLVSCADGFNVNDTFSAVHTEKGEEKLHLLMVDDAIPAGAKLC